MNSKLPLISLKFRLEKAFVALAFKKYKNINLFFNSEEECVLHVMTAAKDYNCQ